MTPESLQEYIVDYRVFLDASKTEVLCARQIVQRLRDAGFVPIEDKSGLSPGDRVFRNVKGRTILAAVVGKTPEELRIVGSHVDSPKLDLKPAPFFEEGRLALLDLHDYGWIKPYQWVNTPLALYGTIFTRKGERIEMSPRTDGTEPVLVIPDLPPHVAGEQMKKPASQAFSVEQLNAVCGGISTLDGRKERGARDQALSHLRERFGLEAEDFACADLSLVPATGVRDVGFDGTLLGGYGQDDRASVFAALRALVETDLPAQTAVGFFVDKEEVASTGETSAQSNALRNFAAQLCRLLGSGRDELSRDAESVLERAQSISADVTTAYDPNFSDTFDSCNIAYLGGGVAVEKYGAAGAGKFRAHEARAEFMQRIRAILDGNGIPWQTGTLAKLGVGGGGTIAQFMSRYGMDCVDAGPALLGMHSPFEIAAKEDLYSAFRMYSAFYSM